MAIDQATVQRVAQLARISLRDDEVAPMQGELNAILAFVEVLDGVDVEGVEPMTSVLPMRMKQRADTVTDGGIAPSIMANAPSAEDNLFMVPRVVE